MATPQFNRKELVREMLGEEYDTSVIISFAEKTDKEIYELYRELKNG